MTAPRMEEIVEAVAITLSHLDLSPLGHVENPDTSKWPQCYMFPEHQANYRTAARAAVATVLEKIAEADEGMRTAGIDASPMHLRQGPFGRERASLDTDQVADIHRAMINNLRQRMG